MGIEFPITVSAMLTVAGAAIFAGIVALWLKEHLPDWRWTNLAVLGLAEIAALVAQLIASSGRPTAEAIYSAFLIGLFGASLATWGYEGISNVLGKLGVGSRSPAALMADAIVKLRNAGYRVEPK